MIVTSEPACWCIFIRAGEDAEVSNFFNALFQFFLIFLTLSPESLFLLFFSYLQKLLVVTIRLQVFALSFVSLRCLAKTIHDIEQQSFCKSVWKNHSCWRLLLLAPSVFSVLQEQKWVDCFRIVRPAIPFQFLCTCLPQAHGSIHGPHPFQFHQFLCILVLLSSVFTSPSNAMLSPKFDHSWLFFKKIASDKSLASLQQWTNWMKEYYLWQRLLIAEWLKTVHRTQEFFSHNQETVKVGLIQPVLTSEISSRN